MPSKLTFHLNGFDDKTFDLLQQMQPGVVKVYEFASDSNIDLIRQLCPKTLIVYRQYTNLGFNDPADWYVNELNDTLNKLKGRGIIWEGLNEPVLNTPQDAQALNNWFVRFADLMHARGEKVAAFSFSTGNPRLEWVPLVAPAAVASDYIALHEYYYPLYGGGDLARYRQFRAQLPANAQKPILITECGADDCNNNGWQKYYSVDQFMTILSDYDKELLKDNYVLGATIFQYGGGAPWQTFNVATIGKRIADYVSSAGGGWTLPIDTPQALEQTVYSSAKNFRWMPINTSAALYQFAQRNNLGYPQTDEIEYNVDGVAYIAQVFNGGVVYVKKGDWGNCKWIKKDAIP